MAKKPKPASSTPLDRFGVDVLEAASLSDAIRSHLATLHAPDPQLASALAYELANIIGKNCSSLEQAEAALRHYAAIGIAQIHAFGVGKEHP